MRTDARAHGGFESADCQEESRVESGEALLSSAGAGHAVNTGIYIDRSV